MKTVPQQIMTTYHMEPGCFLGIFVGREGSDNEDRAYIGLATNHDDHFYVSDLEGMDPIEEADNHGRYPPHEGQWFTLHEAEELHETLGKLIAELKAGYKMREVKK